jgi:hypothetical protein
MRLSRILLAGVLAGGLAAATAAQAGIVITVDKAAQRMSVAVDGVPRYSWPVSTGRGQYATPAGKFTAFRMEEDHFSKEWDDAPMPHSIFFTTEGHAIHGSFDVKRLGTPASHGCVRLAPENAARLFALVKEEGLPNTKVVIAGQEPPLAPAVAKRAPPRDLAPPAPADSLDATYGLRADPAPTRDDYARQAARALRQHPRRSRDYYAERMRGEYLDDGYDAPRYVAPRGYYYSWD